MDQGPAPTRFRRAAGTAAFVALALLGWLVYLAPLIIGWWRSP